MIDECDPMPKKVVAAFLVTILTAAVGALIVISILLAVVTDRAWDPIVPFETQRVIDVTRDHVTVEGIKCYREPVEVRGTRNWQSVDPVGVLTTARGGTAQRVEGCITQTFENPIPVEVFEAEAIRGPLQWVITGTETPTDASGRIGVARAWRTDPFMLPPE